MMMNDAFQELQNFLTRWSQTITLVGIALLYLAAFAAVIHILLVKRDSRAALGWIVVCLGFPGVGTIFYLLFGINRIKMRAENLHAEELWDSDLQQQTASLEKIFSEKQHLDQETLRHLMNISENIIAKSDTKRPLQTNCHIDVLYNGEETYPNMLNAIENAKQNIFLLTYIFETNTTGKKFVAALSRAKDRGIDVKVLLDGVGCLYSFPSAARLLKRKGIRVEKFLPPSFSEGGLHLNLRNHRKILTIDGNLAFTGGMNLGDRHLQSTKRPVSDVHFEVKGPIVGQIQDIFLSDWFFVTKERPEKPVSFDPSPKGETICRAITSGPNEDLEKLRLIYTGAFSCAKKKIRIMTPYFLPDTAMISALNNAVLRGADVEIFLPQKNNLPFIKWASQAIFWELLNYDVKIYYQQGPFVHSKLFLIDDFYAMVGSANLDPRSLRLNFELNLEIYDRSFTEELNRHFERVKKNSRQVTLKDLDDRHILIKLRDGAAKIFSPYL